MSKRSGSKKAAPKRPRVKLEGRPDPLTSRLLGKGRPPAHGRPKVGPKD